LYLRRLMARRPDSIGLPKGKAPAAALAWATWLTATGWDSAARVVEAFIAATPVGVEMELAGPVGERNEYSTVPRGTVLCVAADPTALRVQVGAALATGNCAVVEDGMLDALPPALKGIVKAARDACNVPCDAVLFQGDQAELVVLGQELAEREGAIVGVHVADAAGWYPLEFLVLERSVSTNTAAAGGNANLMMIG
jgi:RHH-type proline utilization regulon transcriptional repressor/proline dehydrogenase/delta 1-pyrroline-5-carboxylate dehydrogenase